jgi:glycosyltransferase involved in cell wall biosynthesis
MSEMPRVSVVVPTYNRAELLRRTLDSLAAQSLPRDDFQVVVSDDGSADHTFDVVRSFSAQLAVDYCYQEDLGYRAASARNAGAKLATAPILVFLDSGTLAGPELLRGHLTAHEEQPGTAVLGYAYGFQPFQPLEGLAEAIATRPVLDVFERYRDDPGFLDLRHSRLADVDFDLSRLTVPWMYLWSLNFSVAAEDFWTVGGFDEAFRTYGTEDVELGYRLHRHGVALRMDRRAWAIEQPHDRDLDALEASAQHTLGQFLDKSHHVPVELVWAVLNKRVPGFFEDRYAELLRWRDEVAERHVGPEITAALADLPPGTRVGVIGCGAEIPDPGGTEFVLLADFDERVLPPAGDGARQVLHGIGLHLPLADDSADVVLVTSRLRGLDADARAAVLAETHRVGARVVDMSIAAQ